jgi:hypothetical protein
VSGRQAPALLLALALAACAGEREPPPPRDPAPLPPSLFVLSPGTPVDGTLRLSPPRGGGPVEGVLDANGQRYRVRVTGLGEAGGRPLQGPVTGEVYGLERMGDGAGRYRDVGGTPANPEATLRLGNQNLVLIELRPARRGTVLTVPPEGATFERAP